MLANKKKKNKSLRTIASIPFARDYFIYGSSTRTRSKRPINKESRVN